MYFFSFRMETCKECLFCFKQHDDEEPCEQRSLAMVLMIEDVTSFSENTIRDKDGRRQLNLFESWEKTKRPNMQRMDPSESIVISSDSGTSDKESDDSDANLQDSSDNARKRRSLNLRRSARTKKVSPLKYIILKY